MQKYLKAEYYGSPKYPFDAKSVIKNFDAIYYPSERGIYTKEDILEYEPDATLLELEGKTTSYCCFKPAGDKRWLMKGYGFIYSTDSRFRDQYGNYPIPLHDRHEG